MSLTDDTVGGDADQDRDPNREAGPTDVRDALDAFGRVVIGPGGGTCSERAHLHRECYRLKDDSKVIEHRAALPLRVETICLACRSHGTDAEGRLNPVDADGEIRDRSEFGDTGRVCGCLDCRDTAFVVIDHPDHGQRAVCPRHQRDYPVIEEADFE